MDYLDILNKNVIRILDVLKKERLYFNQIYERTKIKSKNNLVKNLNLMTKLNILKKEKNKSNTFYKINYDNIFSLNLIQLINTNRFQNLPFERKMAVTELIAKTSPLISVLFGSTAKGNFKKDSDIDILLVYNSKMKDNDAEIEEISSKYGIKINHVTLKLSGLNTKDNTVKHILLTGYPITGHVYFYKVFKDV